MLYRLKFEEIKKNVQINPKNGQVAMCKPVKTPMMRSCLLIPVKLQDFQDKLRDHDPEHL